MATKTMKKLHLFITLCTILMLAACTDDTGIHSHDYSDGLYFHFSSNDWSTNGTRSTRVVSIQDMEASEQLDQPLYLHCEVTEGIIPSAPQDTSSQGQTRAVRYTGPVFNESYGVTSFGIYGTVGSKTAFDGTEVFTRDELTEYDNGSQGSPYASKSWREKENQTINEYWGDDETGDFYGFAPSPYEGGGSVNSCISVDFSDTPTLTYDMPADAADQRDVLTADRTSVSKDYKNEFGIELEFCHVLSALRFKVAYDAEHPENSLKWSIQGTTYYVQPKKIDINDIYSKGSCEIKTELSNLSTHWTRLKADPSDDDYKKCALTTCTINDGTSAYNRTRGDIITDQGLITPDANCFMVLPQLIKDGVKAVIWCDLYTAVDGSGNCTGTPAKTNVRIEAPLYGKLPDGASDPWDVGGDGSLAWCPGYTYTYTLSDIDVAYVFDYNTATEKNYSDVVYGGTSEEDVFIRSYKVSNGKTTNLSWVIQYQETDAEVTGVGDEEESDATTWKTGSNGWIHVYDRSTGSYNTEVTSTHVGANPSDADNVRLFKIEIGSIMTPIIDLSMWDQYQEKRWKGRSTSNCYIVAGPGTYRIPLIYGNAWTNGKKNESAYKTSNSGSNLLSEFLNYKDEPIRTPFIKENVGRSNVKDAVLIWEEGDGTSRTNKGGNGSNEGTVVKVHSTIDTSITGEDAYNTPNTTAGTLTECDYLQFEVDPDNFSYGNAVVGIRDNDYKIIWSWHIWIVDPDWFLKNNATIDVDGDNHKATYASTNIGWVDGGVAVAAKQRTGKARLVQAESGKVITIDATQNKRRAFTTYFTNVLYQWGRKDPMRGNVNTADMQSDDGAPRGVAGVKKWANGYSVTNGTKTVGQMIQEPNTIYGTNEGDLYPFAASYFNLWATNIKKVYVSNRGTWSFFGKTIYDPSPVGYCVPPSKYLTQLTRSKFAEIGAGVTLPIVCNYTDGSTIPFHACGIRTTSGGYGATARGYHAPRATNAANGFYHTATPYSRDENWQLRLYFYSGIDTHNFIRGDMSEALSVLPVIWTGETVEAVDVDPETEYLTFKFLEDGNFYWNMNNIASTAKTIEWSEDDGTTWNSVTSRSDGVGGQLIKAVHSNTVIKVRGTNTAYASSTTNYNYFSSTAEYEVSGNIMSLISGDAFATNKTLTANYTFFSLFRDHHTLSASQRGKLVGADDLILPATTLTQNCYRAMFYNCKGLTAAPKLPAATGAAGCYENMFRDCSNLLTVTCLLAEPSTSYTSNWLNGVDRSDDNRGTFFYKTGASWTMNSVSGIPQYWDAYDIDN